MDAPLTPAASPGPTPVSLPVELTGSFGRFAAVNVAAAVAGAVLLAVMIGIRPGITATSFPLLYTLALLYLVADTAHWWHRGIHRVVFTGDALRVYRGARLREEVFPAAEITDVHLHQRFTRRSLQILLASRVLRLPGATFYPGRKVWLTSDAFELAEFDRLVDAVLPYRHSTG